MDDAPPSENSQPPDDESQRRAARTPQRKMSAAEAEELRELCGRKDLRRADGSIDVGLLARLKGYSYTKVQSFISRDPYLNAQLGEANASKLVPAENQLIDGEPAPKLPESLQNFTKEQWEEYQALVRQNRHMTATDWAKFGITNDDAQKLEDYCRLGSAPMSGVLRLTSGQLIANLNTLQQIINKDAEMVLSGTLPAEYDKDGVPRERQDIAREWRQTVFHGMTLQMQMFAHVHKVQAVMARVMTDLQKLNAGKKTNQKGEFDSRGA